METNWRFVYQQNMYWGSCEPCTASVFATLVRDGVVNWKISMRQAVRRAVSEGQPLDRFAADGDFQRWCFKKQARPRAGEEFAQLATAAKLLQWGEELKWSLPDFVFAVSEFGLVPRLDRSGNPLLDDEGNPKMYRRRQQSNIRHLSGLFMSDYDHLPFPPQELYEMTLRQGFPWKVCLAHITSSGEGLRLVCECLPGAGNIADQQYLQAQELGMLDVRGVTGKPVTDNSCINADKLSFCPRLQDILFIDEDLLFHF
ncbi:MAG: hypothetical protein II949_05530 [Prevotella sp.]|nr:hypothetical protein [Prevotella sp.]